MSGKPWWQSKTIWVGVLELAIAAADLLVGSPLLSGQAATILTVSGILKIGLRLITTGKVTG